MVHVMGLGANKCESNIEKTSYKNRNLSRNCEQGDRARDLETFWRCAHAEILHVDHCGWDFVQDSKYKLGHEQGVGRMGDGT